MTDQKCPNCRYRYTDETFTELAGIDHCNKCGYEMFRAFGFPGFDAGPPAPAPAPGRVSKGQHHVVTIYVKTPIYGTDLLFGRMLTKTDGWVELDWDGNTPHDYKPQFESIMIPTSNIISITVHSKREPF